MRHSNPKSCYLFIPCTMDSHETLMISPLKLGHHCIWRRCGRSRPNKSVRTVGTCRNCVSLAGTGSMMEDLMTLCMCLPLSPLVSREVSWRMGKRSVLWPLSVLRLLSVHPHLLCPLPPCVWICFPPSLVLKHSAHIFLFECSVAEEGLYFGGGAKNNDMACSLWPVA